MVTSPIRSIRVTSGLLALVIGTLSWHAMSAANTAHAATPRINSYETAQVRLINNYRAKHGLARLRIDGTLTKTAEWMSLDMGRYRRFSHTDSRSRDPFQRLRAFGYPSSNTYRGENLAAGNAAAYATFQQWVNSPGHRANMLNRNYRAIGLARVYVQGSPYGYYWTTEFGSRWTRSA